MTRIMMSFFAAISILTFVPSICAAGDDGVKTEKKMAGDDFNIVRDEVIDGIRYITVLWYVQSALTFILRATLSTAWSIPAAATATPKVSEP